MGMAIGTGALTRYENEQIAEIAAWKAEEPRGIGWALKRVRAPIGRLVGKVVSGSMVHKIADKAGALVESQDGLQDVAREAGVGDVAELRSRPLEECDRLANAVSARAQKLALMEGAAAGLGGFITELGNIPVLIAAAERAIRRIGHGYGYRLDTEADRRFVLGILEVSTVDDPAERRRLLDRLRAGTLGDEAGLNGVKHEVIDELMLEIVPLLGDMVSVALDYAFMKRVDISARRIFQERWLRDRGKVTEIPAAILPGSSGAGRHAGAGQAARELVAEAAHLGGFGVGFVVTTPVAIAAALASGRLPMPAARGVADGTRAAVSSAAQFAAGWRFLGRDDRTVSARAIAGRSV